MAAEHVARDARRRLGRQLAAWRRAAGHTQQTLAPLTLYGRSTIANVETGGQRVPRQFWVRCDELLGAGGQLLAAFDAHDALERRPIAAAPIQSRPDIHLARAAGPDGHARTTHAYRAPAPTDPTATRPEIARLTKALLRSGPRNAAHGIDVPALITTITAARQAYQHSRYQRALDLLPKLIADVDHVLQLGTGPPHATLCALVAAVYQTASGLLLKFDASALAAVAADRSLAAATASADPVTIAASSRAIVHTLTAGGHRHEAITTAITAVERLDRDSVTDSPDVLSVRGALLLRAALAAARQEDRHTTNELLSEATDTAQQLGRDSNAASTAFGPTNVVLHRVAAAVHLGDAGTAVHLAGTVDLNQVALPERRAMLHLDVAAAYTQWGKYDRALNAIRTAEHAAPEEVRTRPAAHRILHNLLQASPPHLLPHVRRYADTVGAPA